MTRTVLGTAGVVLARRSVGAGSLWLFGVSASAPMTVLVGGIVTTYAATSVVGVPASFLLVGIALGLLAVGAGAVARYVPHPAPLYAVIVHGAGRPAGVAGGMVAVLAYHAIQISLYGLLGATLASMLGGPWWGWAVVAVAGIGLCGLLRVDIGAGLVAMLLGVELAVIAAFVAGALAHPAPGGLTVGPLLPGLLFHDGVGGVLAFATAAFIGFETGHAYGEEARSHRAAGWVPLATLAFLVPCYTLAAWALAVTVGPDRVNAAAADDPGLPFTVMAGWGPYGQLVASAGTVLLVTGVAAALLSFHSTAARHLFALGREHVLPAWLSRTGQGQGTRRDAPVAGSLTQSAVALTVVTGFAIAAADPVRQLFTWLATLAAIAVLGLLVAASGAAVRWFGNGGGRNESVWQRRIAPILGIGAGLLVLGVMAGNLATLLDVPAGSGLTIVLPALVAVAGLAGLLRAGWLRRRQPGWYAAIGRGRPDPLRVPDQRLGEVRL